MINRISDSRYGRDGRLFVITLVGSIVGLIILLLLIYAIYRMAVIESVGMERVELYLLFAVLSFGMARGGLSGIYAYYVESEYTARAANLNDALDVEYFSGKHEGISIREIRRVNKFRLDRVIPLRGGLLSASNNNYEVMLHDGRKILFNGDIEGVEDFMCELTGRLINAANAASAKRSTTS